MKFNHINIKAEMPLLEKEKSFFCEVLELRNGFRSQFNKKGFWIYLDDNPIIHLTESEPKNRELNNGYVDHLAFQSSCASHFIDRLKKLKVDYYTGFIVETNTLQVFLKSPLGIKIEVVFINERV